MICFNHSLTNKNGFPSGYGDFRFLSLNSQLLACLFVQVCLDFLWLYTQNQQVKQNPITQDKTRLVIRQSTVF
ncbi:hypothetical protein V6N13_078095 [Hibiscus sabdariffa]|uniref:Uncharacterized protein n=1 Tax=Hibiscus sabdariffa TaxID=183260 RepID=A0ABR2RN30_9ROSI